MLALTPTAKKFIFPRPILKAPQKKALDFGMNVAMP